MPRKASRTKDAGLVAQMGMMIRALLASPVRNALFFLGGAIFLVIVATAYGQIRLNRWNQPFYDALAHRDFNGFLLELGVFGVIVFVLLVLNVAQRWLSEMLKLRLRQGLVDDLVSEWLKPGRAFRLASAGPIGVNPDQRMHEDARHLTELSGDLGVQLLQSSILLVTFIDVLWVLSAGFTFHWHGHAFSISGYMVWAAIFYAGTGSLLSYWVGGSLIPRNAVRYQRESELRFALMRINEHVDSITLTGGEADEARRVEHELVAVLRAMKKLVTGVTNLTWVTSGYGWLTLVAPILAAAPAYFAGDLSFGGLMMAAGAFNQVQTSLRWFVDNFSTIADWRATLLRVADFRRAVIDTDQLHHVESHIKFTQGPKGTLEIDGLQIASPQGATMLKEKKVTVKAGEHVLILGEPGTGKTLLFRALAGLWPWGGGTVTRPEGESILYMPRTPYIPPGTLREVLAYPGKPELFRDKDFEKALARFGLERLAPLLSRTRHWEKELGEDEQQNLILARVALHAPHWLLIDEALDTADETMMGNFVNLFTKDLKGTTVIHIGREERGTDFFQRVLHLVKDPGTLRLERPSVAFGKDAENA